MKTEITYTYRGREHTDIVNCRNPSNAPAVLFIKRPELDPSDVKVINCIGYVQFTLPDSHFHSYSNTQNKS